MTLKKTVFAPIPSIRVRMTVMVKPGLCRRERMAYLRSCHMGTRRRAEKSVNRARSKVHGPRSQVDEILIVCSDNYDSPNHGPWTLHFGPLVGGGLRHGPFHRELLASPFGE